MKGMVSSPESVSVYQFLTQKVNFEDLAVTPEDSMRIVDRYHLESYFENYQPSNQNDDNRKSLEIMLIAPDSLGYIFVASNNELIGANTVSGVETRGDNILIIGNENWIDFKSLSFEQLTLLNIVLISPSFIDSGNPLLESLNNRIIESVKRMPNKYHYTGYELVHFIGKMLDQYGVYFQTGMNKMGKIPGVLFEGFDYTEGNDNAVVPLIRFSDDGFRIVN
jgi:hypothetical protein